MSDYNEINGDAYASDTGYSDDDHGYGNPGLVDETEPGLVDPGYDSGYSGYDYSDTGQPGLVDPVEPGLSDPRDADPGYYEEDGGVVDPGYKSPYDPEPGIIDYEDLYQSTEAGSDSGW